MSIDCLVFIPAVCFLTAVEHYIKFMSIKYCPKCDPRIIETLKKNLGFEERAFYHLNQRIQANGTEEIIFHSTCYDATKTITFHNRLMPARAEKPKLFLAEKSNKCDWCITESLKKNLVYEGRALYHLNQRILPKRTRDIIFSVLAVTLQRQ